MDDYAGKRYTKFVLIGDPVAHSLSPVMHNTLYKQLAQSDWHFKGWSYEAVQCADEEAAIYQIAFVRTGEYRGMNVTMPWKRLALQQATYIDPAADAAGGANVLVRKGYDLYAYNTDGLGAVGAIARNGHVNPQGKRAVVFGTGPTSMAIACALANSHAREVIVFSRSFDKADAALRNLRFSLGDQTGTWLRPASYDQVERFVPSADIVVDATPCGMTPGDAAVVDVGLLQPNQVVLDTVYAHGETELLAGARAVGACALDGLEMLVEQAALSVEIWAEALGIPLTVSREVMRVAAMNS